MSILHYAFALIVGTVLVTCAGLSFILFPRPISFANPDLLVLLMLLSGACIIALGARGLASIAKSAEKNAPRA